MTVKARLKAFILATPILRATATWVRNRASEAAVRLAGERRINEKSQLVSESMELEVYRLRSELHRAVVQAQIERDRRLELQARLERMGDRPDSEGSRSGHG